MNLKSYISQHRGLAVKLAKSLQINPVMISLWASGKKKTPMVRCVEIEQLTLGNVRCEELRPDIDWAYFRGKKHSYVKTGAATGTQLIAIKGVVMDDKLSWAAKGFAVFIITNHKLINMGLLDELDLVSKACSGLSYKDNLRQFLPEFEAAGWGNLNVGGSDER